MEKYACFAGSSPRILCYARYKENRTLRKRDLKRGRKIEGNVACEVTCPNTKSAAGCNRPAELSYSVDIWSDTPQCHLPRSRVDNGGCRRRMSHCWRYRYCWARIDWCPGCRGWYRRPRLPCTNTPTHGRDRLVNKPLLAYNWAYSSTPQDIDSPRPVLSMAPCIGLETVKLSYQNMTVCCHPAATLLILSTKHHLCADVTPNAYWSCLEYTMCIPHHWLHYTLFDRIISIFYFFSHNAGFCIWKHYTALGLS